MQEDNDKIAEELAVLEAENTITKRDFQHVVLEGTAYEVGQQQGVSLDDPAGVKRYAAVFPDKSIKTDHLWDPN
jgi:hypothetical protein